MKSSLLSIIAACTFAATVSFAEVRTWTSAEDASKTFEGELTGSTVDKVTIKTKAGKVLTMAKVKLSQADQEYVTKAAEEKAAADKAAAADAQIKESPMAKALKGKTLVLDGKRFKKHDLFETKAPEYYLVYWGASWCGPCQSAAPHLVELYNDKLAASKNVEVVHMSCDQDEAGMESFMSKHAMKFPVVDSATAAKIKLLQPLSPKGIPSYKLVDKDGKVIAEGEEAKSKASELAKSSEESKGEA